jgi:hypothetical protein
MTEKGAVTQLFIRVHFYKLDFIGTKLQNQYIYDRKQIYKKMSVVEDDESLRKQHHDDKFYVAQVEALIRIIQETEHKINREIKISTLMNHLKKKW